MHPIPSPYGVLAVDPLSPNEVALVLENARALQRAAGAGEPGTALRGRKFGLLSEDDGDDAAVLFRRAAAGLGAHVALIRPSLTDLSTPHEVRHTALMLGRLYDAVECQGMSALLVRQVGAEAGIPIFDGVACPGHPTSALAALLGGEASALDKRCFILQAVLSRAIA